VVMDSWQAILSNGQSPAVTCSNQSAHVTGDVAYVVCYEEIDGSFLVATNVFVREARVWRMVHHQAGPVPSPPPPEEKDAPALQ